MKLKENGGTDPVTLSRGFTKLDGDPPNSGESITNPAHVADRREREAFEAEFGLEPEHDGPDGFLDREKPAAYRRPNRTTVEDQG